MKTMRNIQNIELGTRLWKARVAAGKSIQQLSEETGISRRSIGYYESGETDVKAGKLAVLCRTLGVSSDWLLGLADDKGGTVSENYIDGGKSGSICKIQQANVIFEGQKLTFDEEDSAKFAELVRGYFRKLAGLKGDAK